MKKTMRIVLQTGHGIVLVRRTHREGWRTIEATDYSGQDWRVVAANAVKASTGISIHPSQFRAKQRRFKLNSRTRERYEIIHAVATVTDRQIMSEIRTYSENGLTVLEVPYNEIQRDYPISEPVMSFIKKFQLNRAPEAGT